jgi:hypothetical protein
MSAVCYEQKFSSKFAQCRIIHLLITPHLYLKLSILFQIHRLQLLSSLTCYFNDRFSFCRHSQSSAGLFTEDTEQALLQELPDSDPGNSSSHG